MNEESMMGIGYQEDLSLKNSGVPTQLSGNVSEPLTSFEHRGDNHSSLVMIKWNDGYRASGT